MSERYHAEHENYEELTHIINNFKYHSDVEVGVFEDSKEVKKPKPHGESREGVEDPDGSVIIGEDVHDFSNENQERRDNVQPVPEILDMGLQTFSPVLPHF